MVVLLRVHRLGLGHKAMEQGVMLVAKDRGLSPAGTPQLTRPSNLLPTVAGRPCRAAVYGWRYARLTFTKDKPFVAQLSRW